MREGIAIIIASFIDNIGRIASAEPDGAKRKS
jgi:hypothetical protein